jgi:hypothetical protein
MVACGEHLAQRGVAWREAARFSDWDLGEGGGDGDGGGRPVASGVEWSG